VIDLVEVTKVFGSGPGAVTALDGVTLHVEPGEILGVIGTSGAGKSTLIRCVNLLETPTSGQVTVDGREMTALSSRDLRAARRRIGMIFQHFNLLDSRTAVENIAFPLELEGMPAARRRARSEELLERVGLAGRGGAYPAQLSGGQKQRVAIARALAADTHVLLCDEATSALDPETTKSILDLLRELNRDLGLTIMLITHSLSVLSEVCTTVAQIEAGRITDYGPLHELVGRLDSPLGRALLPALPDLPPGVRQDHVVEFVAAGALAEKPALAAAIRHFDADLRVVGGAIADVGGQTVARFRIAVPDEIPRADVVGFLNSHGIEAEMHS
jgi:D-methionine transport system ATP-binding protein